MRSKIRVEEVLKQARCKLNLSKRQFAELLGVSKSAYCRYENGERKPPLEVIKKCCRILGLKFYLRRAEDGVVSYNSSIGRKISLLRRLRLIPLKAVAIRSGISYLRLQRIEAGLVIPTRAEVGKIARVLGYSPSVFRRENFVRLLMKFKSLFME